MRINLEKQRQKESQTCLLHFLKHMYFQNTYKAFPNVNTIIWFLLSANSASLKIRDNMKLLNDLKKYKH